MSDAADFEFMMRRRVERIDEGRFRLRLASEERDLLRGLPGQLRELLDEGGVADPALVRLFPPAYQDDDERNAEYQRLMGDELRTKRRAALDLMAATIDAHELTEEQVVAWMGAINDLRLVLGTRLDVTEEMYEEGYPPDDPRAPLFDLFAYLGLLMEQVVGALAGE